MINHGDEKSHDSDGLTARRNFGRREQILYRISILEKMCAITSERSHCEYDIPRRFPGEDNESLGCFVETLFPLELCTRALVADRIEMVKEFMNLSL